MTKTTIALVVLLILLAGCAGRDRPAPVVDARSPRPAASKPPAAKAALPAQPAPRAADERYYTVKRGDTLYSIALEHGADYRDVAQWNRLDDPTKIRVGQQLRVAPPDNPAEGGAVQIGTVRAPNRLEARPLESPPPAAAAREEAKTVPLPPAAQFIWPAKGRVTAGFAEPRSKGIDIEGKPGDPVVAAAAGRVTYMGTGIPGLGKLVVIKHDNGFITVYAHNRAILVKEQQTVARGQRIAEFGTKLHFQIRKGAAAVDPLLYLPRS
ncbi:MAG: LysM peptidoglycan-binding domain-containing protein [Betaproteobacteria bacterium]|nr:MAG: LysM peptidoglycan-binding domain-containing protein [Betaproteobacteria bacterium]